MPYIKVLAFLVFAVAWLGPDHYNPFNVLWSIGVEEQYYMFAPLVAKFGGRQFLRRLSYVAILISFAAMIAWTGGEHLLWYNPLVEFLFFAIGGLLALHFHNQANERATVSRVLLFSGGVAFWLVAQAYGHISVAETPPTAIQNCMGYGSAAIGTLLVFVAFSGAPSHWFPRWLLYLGKISYGLYVFHVAVMEFVKRALPQTGYEVLDTSSVLAGSLLLTIGVASLSFHYFEKPFLRLKSRFEFIKTR